MRATKVPPSEEVKNFQLYQPEFFSFLLNWPRGIRAERGVENRERAWFFGSYITYYAKKSERFSEQNFLAGKILRPREAQSRGAS